jgi:TetR/AcrR family transcriptional regulator, mexJK operon transcriptional repressor
MAVMTTPVRGRSAAKRKAIVDAAMATFLEHGYERSSVDAIAAAAGVGKQTVYGHFGDKEKLFLSVIAEAPAAAEIGAEAVADTGDPLADLTAAVKRTLDVVLSPQVAALHRLTIAELAHHPELQRMWRDGTNRTGSDTLIAEYLKACDERGLLVVPDPALAARQLVVLAVSEGRVATLQGSEPLKKADRDRIAAQAAELIVRAYRA